ncbi:PREDICTED: G-type lectin S-receptor-like serine/threonine-protein kinase At1g11280 [Prunus mume]|uniref:G-type lectin S-receptor-like serine/threonine-protein kinase At1g11280 n=1 Tax=Prunus mume TaxID=102107 RepID=A0ABM0PT79_PRUMU|nr:PREDICTED: G-type lectin S-receptor-like serine/threonine-protein kinase At1g11280 [Prunus mume]
MRRAVLDWAKRFNIIQGVARGLVYLHHDSCLKVLDEKMSPKFEFWLARIFQGTQNLANTQSQKVVGTLYMSLEYACYGRIFSEKSHAYSFGVLLLKIIGGRKNTSFYYHDQQLLYLLSKAVFDPLPQYDNICSANEATITLLKG